jgi:hypothetical protein
MASFEIATKANLASVLPGLLVALQIHLEQPSLLPTVTRTFHDGVTLTDKQEIRMTLNDGKTLTGRSIIRHLAEVATSTLSSSQRAAPVGLESHASQITSC